MAIEAKLTVDNTGFILGGGGIFKNDQTLAQDAPRATALEHLTVLSKQTSDGKLIPLTDVDPALTSAYLTCGANGGNVAAYAAVADGEFAITVDGEAIDVTGLDFNTVAVTALQQVEEVINAAANGRFICQYDLATDTFIFISPTSGLPMSSITVLSAVSGGSGTDISGASFLNGLSGTGTVTAATGGNGENLPFGLYWNNDLAAASLVAADVTNQKVLIKGKPILIDEDLIVLENSLTLASVVTATGKTIRQHLEDLGIIPTKSYTDGIIAS